MSPASDDLTEIDARSTAAAVRSGALSPLDVAHAWLQRGKRLNDELGAFLHVDADATLASAVVLARTIDDARSTCDAAELERRFPLAGVTVAVKDAFATRGTPTTCGSRILEGYVPPYDAHVIERVRASGALIVGKTNMDEFAMGSSNENSGYGPARNPWDRTRVPGGSSGGSAVSVAARLAHVALGSDTGGSVRQPAALTGIVGFKPTYGRVSRYGLVAFASSLDVVGTLGSSVLDAALLYDCIAGHDPRDSTCVDREHVASDVERDERGLSGVRVGIPREYYGPGMEPGVAERVRAATDAVARAGADVVDVSMPHTRYAIAAYYVLASAEASSNLARYDGVRYGIRRSGRTSSLEDMYGATRDQGFGAEVKRRILLGTFALSAGYHDAFYGKAQRVRTLIRRDFDAVFETVDVLLAPTSPTVAFPLGSRTDDPVAMYLSDVCTLPASLAGVPAVSIACGLSAGLPVGLQLIGPAFAEKQLLSIAASAEKLFGRLTPPARA